MMRGTGFAGERSSRSLTLARRAASVLILLSALVSCREEQKAAPQAVRPVRTVTVELHEGGEKVSLTGEIQPRYQADLAHLIHQLVEGGQ
jgi:membrane fusion protein, multidrug efflux system